MELSNMEVEDKVALTTKLDIYRLVPAMAI